MFSGSIPALVTPFRGGSFDEPAFRKLVEWQIEMPDVDHTGQEGSKRGERSAINPWQSS